jgi:hypothetical protein
MDGAGNLCGTTENGGSKYESSLYEPATNGTLSVLHSLAVGTGDGGAPIVGDTINKSASEILGTTNYGDDNEWGGSGCRTVFRLRQ